MGECSAGFRLIFAHGSRMNFTVLNSVSNAIADLRNWTTAPVLGGDPGLRLLVAPGIPPNSLVPVAEVDSSRVDLLYGSYRFGVKVPSIAGTCTSVYFVSITSHY